MLRFFGAKYAIDPSRTFVMGFSNGGHMAFGLAHEVPEKIAAIAVIGANLPVGNNLDCKRSGKPLSVAILNGRVDPMNPYKIRLAVSASFHPPCNGPRDMVACGDA